MRLSTGNWKVGLHSISLPDAEINVLKLGYLTDDFFLKSDPSLILFRESFVRYPPIGTTVKDAAGQDYTLATKQNVADSNREYVLEQQLSIKEMRDAEVISNGVEFLTFAIDWMQQKRLRTDVKKGMSMFDNRGHSIYPSFSWEKRAGKDELVLNSQLTTSNKDHGYV